MDHVCCHFLNLKTGHVIEAKHNEMLWLGRNAKSKIEDLTISRKQLQVNADLKEMFVHIKAIGKVISAINGLSMRPTKCYHMKDKDIVELKLGGDDKFQLILESKVSHENKANVSNVECQAHKSGSGRKRKAVDANDIMTKRISNGIQRSTKHQIWDAIDDQKLLIYTPENLISKDSIAAFDLDGTLIKTKSGKRFPKDKYDWTFNYPSVVDKLKELHKNNHKIVIFTNQGGLAFDKKKVQPFKEKIEAIVTATSIPIQVFVATNESIYRKPAPGMWNTLKALLNDNIDIDLQKSFYIGDAAGRCSEYKHDKKKDHSCADRLFALNISVKFYTPEEFFLNKKAVPFVMPEFDPRKLKQTDIPNFASTNQEVVVMVGVQASGKSTFCKRHLIPKGYVHISRDDLGNLKRCISRMEEELLAGKSVVIDNTNPDPETRTQYVNIAKKHKIPCRCFLMTTDIEHAKHNLIFRKAVQRSRNEVNFMILNSFKNKYKEPTASEGFQEILKINFFPAFDSPDEEELYYKFLI